MNDYSIRGIESGIESIYTKKKSDRWRQRKLSNTL